MGIVFRQSIKNIISTYLGFIIGAINILFLFNFFMSKEEYGLISYILSVGNILTPLLTFGVHNTFIKFYPSYREDNQRNKFVTLMFLLPLCMILVGGIITGLSYHFIYNFISNRNAIVGDYIWTMFLISTAMAYFEVFYAWARIHLKTVEGNFLKEVFPRIVTSVLLIFIFLKIINLDNFIALLCLSYFIRMFLMLFISFRIKTPCKVLGLPQNYKATILYSIFLIISGAVATLLIDIDKFMLNQYLPLEQIAVYTVAVYIATVIVVPYRAIYQLINPMISKQINEGNLGELGKFYTQSTNNIFFIGIIVFLLIILNAKDLYSLIPNQDYDASKQVLFFIAVVKLLDTLNGVSNAILFNSKYYRIVIYLGILLVIKMIILNLIFIPKWGIQGAAMATFIAFLIYNSLKIYFVYKHNGLHPFSVEVIKISTFALIMLLFYWVELDFLPIVNIFIKSILILVVTILIAIYFNFSTEFSALIKKFFTRKNK